MAKRFTDTDKWNDEWYLSLSNDYRIVWQWLLDNCDHAGIIKRGVWMLNTCCRTTITEQDLLTVFKDRIYLYDTFYFIPKFVKFQYETGLNSDKPVIKSVRKLLQSKRLDILVNELYGNDYITVNEPLDNRSIMIKDKDKDKEISNTGESKISINPEILHPVVESNNTNISATSFDDFWNLYDKKQDRMACEKKWNKLSAKDKADIMEYLPKYKLSQSDKKYRKNPETFINNRSWENEIIDSKAPEKKEVFTQGKRLT